MESTQERLTMNALPDFPKLIELRLEFDVTQSLTSEAVLESPSLTDELDFPISTEALATEQPCRHWGINE